MGHTRGGADMNALPHTLFVIDAHTSVRCDEAWRAALGATLHGGTVHVVVTPAATPFCQSALAQRAWATLVSFGHHVQTTTLAAAHSALQQHIEIWR